MSVGGVFPLLLVAAGLYLPLLRKHPLFLFIQPLLLVQSQLVDHAPLLLVQRLVVLHDLLVRLLRALIGVLQLRDALGQ